jgi:hypothetical protein
VGTPDGLVGMSIDILCQVMPPPVDTPDGLVGMSIDILCQVNPLLWVPLMV